ncbi:MAG: hypothetical protein AAGA85_22185 [Bacteroidota bacterium]
MKLLLRLLLIALMTYFLLGFLPWWTMALLAGFAGFLIPGSGLNSFISGFLGGGLVWLYMSWMIDNETQSILTDKMVQLFPIDDTNLLILGTGLLGGLVAGFGALTGTSFRQIFMKKKKRSLYN